MLQLEGSLGGCMRTMSVSTHMQPAAVKHAPARSSWLSCGKCALQQRMFAAVPCSTVNREAYLTHCRMHVSVFCAPAGHLQRMRASGASWHGQGSGSKTCGLCYEAPTEFV